MRAHIRSVKPEALTDEALWDLEQETGLPIFRAFVGLWTQADREGRFEWRPRPLKAAVLPYWDGDFSRVLDALTTRGFLVRYTVDGREYGWVRNFLKHQLINNREAVSVLPPPPKSATKKANDLGDSQPRAQRVVDASATGEGNARGEGIGSDQKGAEGRVADAPEPPPPDPDPPDPDDDPAPEPDRGDPPEHLLGTHHVERAWHAAAHGAGALVLHGEAQWRSEYATILEAAKLAVPIGRRIEALGAVCGWFWSAPDGPVAGGRVAKPTPATLAKGVSNDLASAYEWWRAREAAQ